MICGGQRRALAFADMSKRTMRASDADRDRIVDRLNKAAIEGRIAAEELEQRVSAALKARTYGELDDTVSDLPGPKAHRTPARRSGAAAPSTPPRPSRKHGRLRSGGEGNVDALAAQH